LWWPPSTRDRSSGRCATGQLGNWARAAKARELMAPGFKRARAEQMDLSRLRAERARLKMCADMLKSGSTAYLAEVAL
jgi:transposase